MRKSLSTASLLAFADMLAPACSNWVTCNGRAARAACISVVHPRQSLASSAIPACTIRLINESAPCIVCISIHKDEYGVIALRTQLGRG
eukprot:SAG31_NODE_865_length_11376_cov_4.313377_7_plen_89_part_00